MPSTDQKTRIMKALGCDEKTAEMLMADDKAVDQGKKMDFDLPPDKMKNTKHRGHKAPTVYTHTKRERKADDQKRNLVRVIAEALTQAEASEVVETNPERQIDFQYKGRKFRVVLSAPRS